MKVFFLHIIVGTLIFGSLYSCGSGKEKEEGKKGELTEILLSGLPETDSVQDESAAEEPLLLNLPTKEEQLTYMRTSGKWDKYREGILPQMAEDAPSYSEKILQAEGKRFIIVDKAKMKLFLYDCYGNIEKSYGIACAKNYGTKHKKGDSRTTEGIFKVKGVFDSTEWLFTDDDGYTSPTKGQYGPRFIRLNIPYIGIHGTGNPKSIGKRVSHGCIRVTNDNIMELVNYVEEGMPVIISPGPRDMAVNLNENTRILSVSTEPGSPKAVARRDYLIKEEQIGKKDTIQANDSLPVMNTDNLLSNPEEPGHNPIENNTNMQESQPEIEKKIEL